MLSSRIVFLVILCCLSLSSHAERERYRRPQATPGGFGSGTSNRLEHSTKDASHRAGGEGPYVEGERYQRPQAIPGGFGSGTPDRHEDALTKDAQGAPGGSEQPGQDSKTISLKAYLQEQSGWCWASATQALILAYTGKYIKQCVLASRHIADKDDLYCCGARAAGAECNKGIEADIAVSREGMGIGPSIELTREDLIKGIEKYGAVLGSMKIGGNVNHAIIIHRYREADSRFLVFDPLKGNSWLSWSEIEDGFSPNGINKLVGVLAKAERRVVPVNKGGFGSR